jgi:hypothetical protein
MVRGVAKAQSQAKAQKKADAMKSHGSQLEDQKKGLKLICPACKVSKQGSEQLGGVAAVLCYSSSSAPEAHTPRERVGGRPCAVIACHA